MPLRRSVPSYSCSTTQQSFCRRRFELRSPAYAAFRFALRITLPLLVFDTVRRLSGEPKPWIQAASAGPATNSTDDSENCAAAPPFPRDELGAQSDTSAVYTRPALFAPSSIFRSVGIVRYITVFGIPIVATGRIGDAALSHVSSIFADFLDNDRDGKADNESVVGSLRSYLVILGFLTDSEESSEMWSTRAELPTATAFKQQFECRFRFFELWRSDTNPKWHTAKRRYKELSSSMDSDMPRRKRCAEFRAEPFDWPLWYIPFTIAYYGYLDNLNEQQNQVLDAGVEKAKSLRKFSSQYPDEPEMEKADFFAWTVLTRLGATECHCDSSDVGATWKVCTLDELQSLVPEWIQILNSLQGIPEHLHDKMYASPAVVGSDNEKQP